MENSIPTKIQIIEEKIAQLRATLNGLKKLRLLLVDMNFDNKIIDRTDQSIIKFANLISKLTKEINYN